MKLENLTTNKDSVIQWQNQMVWCIDSFVEFCEKRKEIYSPKFKLHNNDCCIWQFCLGTYFDINLQQQCVKIELNLKVSNPMKMELHFAIINKKGECIDDEWLSLVLEKPTEQCITKPIEESRFYDVNDDAEMTIEGELTIACNIRLATVVDNCQALLFKDIGKLLDDKILTDVTITVGPKVFRAHRLILIARSEFFNDLLITQHLDAITIDDVDEHNFNLILNYIYKGHAHDALVIDNSFQLLLAADKFKLSELKKLCETIISETLTIEEAAIVLKISEQCSAKNLKTDAINFILVFLKYVVVTESWKELTISHPHLVIEVTLPMAKTCRCLKKLINNQNPLPKLLAC